MSQITTGIPTSGPGSGTVTSITFNGGLTSTPDPVTTTGTATLDQTNLTVADGTVYWNSSSQLLSTTAVGTSGWVLTSQGAGMPPVYAAPGGIMTIDGDSGSITGSTVFIQTGASTQNSGATFKFVNSATVSNLNVTDLNDNTLIGYLAGNGTFSGNGNTGFGYSVGQDLTSGSYNTGVGFGAVNAITSGSNNTAFGKQALPDVTTGSNNIAIGFNAGERYATGSESSNIVIGNIGSASESNVLRLGTNGSGAGQQNSCYIAGIDGVNVGSTATVVTEASNQLGTAVITAGSGISITPGANTITITNTAAGITTAAGDSGTATGSTVTWNANSNSGSTVKFTATGSTVSLNTTDSNLNISIGAHTAAITGGANNTSVGAYTFTSLTGNSNSAFGAGAQRFLTTGTWNTSMGEGSMGGNPTSASYNVGVGAETLNQITTGSYNSCFGYQAGTNYTGSESSNIAIGYNNGGTASESNVLRIGNGTGTSAGNLNSAYISGITGITVTGTAVLVSTSNQLGISVSSRKYKENIVDMGSASSDILKLRPVTFTLKGHEDQSTQFGLIAEEVAEIMPDLIVYDKQGDPQTVQYHELPALLLNELQKALRRIEVLEEKLNVK